MAKDKNNDKKYFYALGRRKTSTATVRLYEGKGESTINGNEISKYYHMDRHVRRLYEPLTATNNKENFYFTVKSHGGGTNGQLDSIVLGLARALVKFDESLKDDLKKLDLLSRDDRMVERKKTGRRKARRSRQFSKR